MNVNLTGREVTAIRCVMNGWKHSDKDAEKTAKQKIEKAVQADSERLVNRIVGKSK